MENKKISIDLEHFKISNSGGTRKKKKTDGESTPIQVRQPRTPRDRTTKRHSLLKFLRKHQEKNYQKLAEDESYTHAMEHQEVKNELDDTLSYLMNLVEKENKEHKGNSYTSTTVPNYTLKHTPSTSPLHENRRHSFTNENVSMEFPVVVPAHTAPVMQLNPQYGCLKQGNLPTYRNYMQKQQQPRPPFYESSNVPSYEGVLSRHDNISEPLNTNPERDVDHRSGGFGRSDVGADTLSFENATSEFSMNPIDPSKVKLKYMRQKRTNSRTFKLGKSKNQPKVGVLISNRTIRKGITNQGFLLKQTPMHEIRKFLEKRGLVKVGTAAPNEVLRKMYESTKMMCGEVYNHNSETLLHNFIHMK
jgi:hypothetical protein